MSSFGGCWVYLNRRGQRQHLQVTHERAPVAQWPAAPTFAASWVAAVSSQLAQSPSPPQTHARSSIYICPNIKLQKRNGAAPQIKWDIFLRISRARRILIPLHALWLRSLGLGVYINIRMQWMQSGSICIRRNACRGHNIGSQHFCNGHLRLATASNARVLRPLLILNAPLCCTLCVSEGRSVPCTIIYLDCRRAFCLDNRVIWFDYVFVLMLDIKYYYQQACFMQSFRPSPWRTYHWKTALLCNGCDWKITLLDAMLSSFRNNIVFAFRGFNYLNILENV
jgi:hypothetical protein